MRLILLTALTMIAFAGNSVLNRMAVGQGLIEPLAFAAVRVLVGAIVLAGLVALRRRGWPGWAGRGAGVGGLSLYLIGFSLAYAGLDAGTGALILFGSVQITMFAGAVAGGEVVPRQRWIGAAVAFGGLVLLLAPAGVVPSLTHAALMAGAGFGWGVYSLAGRGQADALGATAANFALSVPVVVGLALALPGDWMGHWSGTGVALAVLSGAVTSGLGYALWYGLLPVLGAARAGLVQLTVPMLAALGGVIVLSEPLTLRFVAAAGVVLGGVVLGSRQSGLAKR